MQNANIRQINQPTNQPYIKSINQSLTLKAHCHDPKDFATSEPTMYPRPLKYMQECSNQYKERTDNYCKKHKLK